MNKPRTDIIKPVNIWTVGCPVILYYEWNNKFASFLVVSERKYNIEIYKLFDDIEMDASALRDNGTYISSPSGRYVKLIAWQYI